MKQNYSSKWAGDRRALVYQILMFSTLAGASGWLTTTASAQTTRDWTGAASANWSDPNNWSPAGVPQYGDTLQFGYVGDSHRTSVNDLPTGLSISNLFFINNDYQVNGNALGFNLIRGGDNTLDNSGGGSHTITINCPLVASGSCNILALSSVGQVTENTATLYLNGPITVNEGADLTITAGAFNHSAGYNSHVFVSGQISGSGDVTVFAGLDGGHASTVEFNGSPGNALGGTFNLNARSPAQIVFNKASGAVVTNRLLVDQGNQANLYLAGPNQIDNNAIIEVDAGSQLQLSGNNVTVGSLVFTNYSADAQPSTLDTGSVLVGLNGGITSSVNNDHVHPTIKGRLNLNGFLPFNISGGPEPGLEILATIEGNGFQKLGAGTLLLDGTNTFFGDAEITEGTVEALTPQAFGQAGPTYGAELDGGNLVLESVAIGAEPLFVNSAASFLTSIDQCSWAGPVTLNTDFNVVPLDTTYSGLDLNFSGAITGSGGLNLQPALVGVGNVQLSGPAGNLYTGPTTVNCQLLELNKPSGVNAYAGPLIVGGAAGSALHEARWLQSYQNVGANLTLYDNGLVNLNNNNEDFGPVTFNGGTVDSGPGGRCVIYQPLTVNPSAITAVINGNFGLAAGADRVLNVGDGAADPDLQVNAVIYGSPGTYFVKQGAGTMLLTGANTFDAPTLLEGGILGVYNGTGLGTWPGLVIFDGATLQISGAVTGNGFEAIGAGVGGTHGAVELLPNASFNIVGGVLLDGATTINTGANGGGGVGFGGIISGTGPLIETGSGTMVFSGTTDNNFTGDTVISSGGFYLGKSSSHIAVPNGLVIGPGPAGPPAFAELLQPGGIGGGSVQVNANALFNLNGFNETLSLLTLDDGGSVQTSGGTLSLAIGANVNVGSQGLFGSHVQSILGGLLALPAGSATFNVSPPAPTYPLLLGASLDVTATISGGTFSKFGGTVNKYGMGQLQFDGNNTYSSLTRIYEGTLIAANAGALGGSGSTSGTSVYEGASLALNNGISVASEYLYLDSTNNAALDSRSTSDGWGGEIYLNRNSAINVNSYLIATGLIDGPGALVKTGPGSLALSGGDNNTYAGETFVNQGTLLLNKPAAVTAIPGPVEVGAVDGSSAGVVRNLNSYQIIGNILVHSQGLYDVNDQVENADYLGLDGNAVVQTGTGYLSLKTGGQIAVTPGVNTTATINHHLHLDPGNHLITVGSGTTAPGVNDLVINADIADETAAAAIQKEGPGRMRLTYNNTYTGSTIVNAGTLQVDGAQTQSPVTVNGGTLQGIGSVGAISMTAASAAVAPGDSPGILTCGNLDAAGGSGVLRVELNGSTPGTGYDQLDVNGSVNLSGITLNASLGFVSSTNDQFTIIANDGSDPVTGTFTGLPQGQKFYIGQERFQISYGNSGSPVVNDVVLSRLTTPPPPALTIQSVPPASVLLVWPTNDPPFSLQVATNFPATNWIAALPLPVVVGTNNLVTNSVTDIGRFYRLSNP